MRIFYSYVILTYKIFSKKYNLLKIVLCRAGVCHVDVISFEALSVGVI